MVCRIELLGGLRVVLPDRVITRFRTRKTALLLGYLACFPRRGHTREELIERLWPDLEPSRSRNSLSQALTSLRRQIEPPGVPAGAFLEADRETVRLNVARVATDLGEMEEAIGAAERIAVPGERTALLTRGVDLYRGPLLHGYAESWILEQQERVAMVYFRAVDQLLSCLEAVGDAERALVYAQRAVELDPLRDETRRVLMRLLAARGEPEAALREFHHLERGLRRELDAAPEEATRSLAATIAGTATTDGRRLVVPLHRGAESRAIDIDGACRDVDRGDLPTAPIRPVTESFLPLSLTRFFGREEELALLIDLLAGDRLPGRRLVTLTGPGGSGKTRLALEAARGMVSRGDRPAETPFAWFVPLADLSDARHLMDAVRDTLRLPRDRDRDSLDQVAEYLGSRLALLALDNFEHLVSDGALQVRALLERVPGLTCLVTSRCPLALEGEQEFPVPPLPVPGAFSAVPEALLRNPSVRLFVDRAQAVQPDFQVTAGNADAVAEVCRRLEGIPLAIELAAARARLVPPARMLDHLEHRFDFLVSRRRDAAARHQTLREAIDWSFRLLSPEQQRIFVCLSVFRGGWTAEAATAVAVIPAKDEPPEDKSVPNSCVDSLTDLCDASLILADEADDVVRFRMLEMLREFAGDLAEERGELAVLRRRYANYFLDLAQRAAPHLEGPEQRSWLRCLETERPNLRAALAWLIEAGEAEVGLRLGAALHRFWIVCGYWSEGRKQLSDVLALAGAERRSATRATVLNAAGIFATAFGQYDEARSRFHESLEIRQVLEDRSGVAHVTLNLGVVALFQSQYETARKLSEESLVLYRELGDETSIAKALNNLGLVARAQGEYNAGRSLHDESLEICRRLSNQHGIACSLSNQSLLALDQGEDGAARKLCRDSLILFWELGVTPDVAQALDRLAAVEIAVGRLHRAARLLGAAEALRRTIGVPVHPIDRGDYEHWTAVTREGLGQAAHAAAYEGGLAMTAEQAVAYAIEEGSLTSAAPEYGRPA